ncbi:MAG: proton-conducting transporter membrane subunit, partial [Thiolinea sp.]
MEYTEYTASWPLLGLLQLLPFLTGLVLIRLRGKPAILLALVVSVLEISLAATLYLSLQPGQPAGVMQFGEQVQLLGALHYHAAVDGMSVLFVLLTAILGFLCVFFILFRRQQSTSILAVMLGIQATLMSMFVTVDLLWFALMSVLELFWVAYVTKRWPASDDPSAALVRFLQFMLVSLLLLLIGILILGWNHADQRAGNWSFSLYHLGKTGMSENLEALVFFLLFYALGIRLPVFPFHGWLPDFLKFGNAAVAPIYLLGMKVSLYGMLRFVFPLTPQAAWDWHKVAVGFAVAGVFYAALLALRQQNLRSLLAFAIVSHTGILTIGLFSLDPVAMQGSVLLALNFGLAISGLLF